MPPWNAHGMPIRRLFFLHMLLFLVLILLGVVAVLSLSSWLRSASDTVILLSKEKDHLAQNTQKRVGEISAQAVSLSKELSASLERRLDEYRLSMSDLSGKPDVLTKILDGEINRLLFSLEKIKSSGVFIVLDATVNPDIEGAATSRAGLYIRNIDQGFMDRNADQLFLRGPTQIAIAEGFTLQSRWALEFDVQGQPFWECIRNVHEENPELPLSRLYYWYFSEDFPGLSENTGVCSVPLLGGDGRFLGVCGFETGARRFARDNAIDTHSIPNPTGLFFTFSAPDEKIFYPGKALLTGNAIQVCGTLMQHALTIEEDFHGLKIFSCEGNSACVGLWSNITLYPADSPFADQRFATAIVAPKKNFDSIVTASRLRLVLIGVILLCIGVALSLYLSDRCEKPFKELLKALQSGDMSAKSHIHEIDDLLEFMRSQLDDPRTPGNSVQEAALSNEINGERGSGDSTEDLLESFIANTRKLSRAEADVFNLYLEGYTAQEITGILSLSINTIKTHNRRIFAKLNVASRKELLAWVQVLTASGRSLDDARQKQFDKIRSIVKSV
ncbi:LuxR C-terminal-related transcriptional regulator [Synergistaceae bacterium OttesenSCG-928-I11]|nr:LuxR C-terminal-related transcriptional regulator [Synergistaceae bacterium OttesenSCG-928-I11]